jgi:uncharacterized membrane-anchored protein YhcB (DUF1043 family)
MNVQYLTNQKGKTTAVVISIREWQNIQKELGKKKFFNELETTMQEVNDHFAGKKQLRDAKDFILNEL